MKRLFALLYFSFSLIALIIATATDLKERIVSDKLSYGLIIGGLALHAIESAATGNYSSIEFSAAAGIATFLAGLLLWKLGVLAGGDVKLFTGIAAMVPTNPNFFGSMAGIPLLGATSLPVFPLSLFIFSVFAMLPYGTLLAINALRKKREKAKEITQSFRRNALRIAELSIAAIAFTALLGEMKISALFALPALAALGIIPKAFRIAVILLAAFFALSRQPLEFAYNSLALFAAFFFFFAIIKLAMESQGLLNRKKKISELKEGEIVAETILLRGGKAERYRGVSIARIINHIKANNLQAIKEQLNPAGKVVCSHRSAGGVTKEEISGLKKLVSQGLLEDKMEIKESAAFVPAILIAFIILNIVGDLLWNVILR